MGESEPQLEVCQGHFPTTDLATFNTSAPQLEVQEHIWLSDQLSTVCINSVFWKSKAASENEADKVDKHAQANHDDYLRQAHKVRL
mmetsp:Transcript_12554/g.34312  ORF Transcript_12554/g.34312 Transcript_12554/m.34312 type:complete len:86 (-) Transcript_12554:1512-1769(-)|eukprot:1143836-Pelagomonas_calceolata.AAC.6